MLNEERDPHNHSISQSRAIPAEPENVPSTKRAAAVNGSQRLALLKRQPPAMPVDIKSSTYG